MSAKRSVSIRILNQNHQIYSDASSEKIEKITALLNDNIEAVLTQTKAPLSYKTVLLAALNITERFVDLNEAHIKLKAEVAERSERVLGLLENVDIKPVSHSAVEKDLVK